MLTQIWHYRIHSPTRSSADLLSSETRLSLTPSWSSWPPLVLLLCNQLPVVVGWYGVSRLLNLDSQKSKKSLSSSSEIGWLRFYVQDSQDSSEQTDTNHCNFSQY